MPFILDATGDELADESEPYRLVLKLASIKAVVVALAVMLPQPLRVRLDVLFVPNNMGAGVAERAELEKPVARLAKLRVVLVVVLMKLLTTYDGDPP